MRIRSTFALFASALFAISACTSVGTPTTTASPEQPLLPVAAPHDFFHDALTMGRLEISNGCVVLKWGETDNQITWPHGYSLIRKGNNWVVTNGSKEFPIGAAIRAGGGGAPVTSDVPACPGATGTWRMSPDILLEPHPSLIVAKQPSEMSDRLEGVLMQTGCLAVSVPDGPQIPVAWPPGFKVTDDEAGWVITDGRVKVALYSTVVLTGETVKPSDDVPGCPGFDKVFHIGSVEAK